MRQPGLVLTILCALVLLSSCQRQEPKTETNIIRAYKLIDANRADEAIILLEDMSAKEPKNREILVALASANASFAGINVPSLYPAIDRAVLQETFKKLQQEVDALSALQSAGFYKPLDGFTRHWTLMFKFLSSYIDTFRDLPFIPASKSKFLFEAISILQSISDKTRGQALFSAVLRVLYLKRELTENLIPMVLTGNSDETCKLNFKSIGVIAEYLRVSGAEIASDLGAAYPAQSKDFQANAKNLEQLSTLIQTMTSSENMLTDAAAIMAVRIGIEESLGKVIQCR